jgi:hypothetical protein
MMKNHCSISDYVDKFFRDDHDFANGFAVNCYIRAASYRKLFCVATVDSRGRTIFIADARRDNGKRFVVRADERLTAFAELESAHAFRHR